MYLAKATKFRLAPFRIISMEKRRRMAFLFVVRPKRPMARRPIDSTK